MHKLPITVIFAEHSFQMSFSNMEENFRHFLPVDNKSSKWLNDVRKPTAKQAGQKYCA
jgi:hypothetical protein